MSRKARIGGGVAAGAVAAAVAGWALAGGSTGGSDAAAPRVTVTAESEGVAPVTAPSVASGGAGTADVMVDLDGIADDEYPEAAATRTDPNIDVDTSLHIEYPDALVLEEWVWDRVGPGWSMEVASVTTDISVLDALDPYHDEHPEEAEEWFAQYGGRWQMPAAVLYLVSPEEVYFEVGALPERMWDGARVVSWDEDAAYVRLAWAWVEGGRYDLRTGASEDLEFAVYGEPSTSVAFVMANADGDELWEASSANGMKYYRWDASTEEWAASALVEALPQADSVDLFPGIQGRNAQSPDSDTLVVADYRGGYDSGRTGQFGAYVLSDDDLTVFEIPALAGDDYLNYMVDAEGVRLASAMDDGDPYYDYSFTSRSVSSGTLTEGALDPAQSEPWDGRVGWGESTNEAAAWYLCGC